MNYKDLKVGHILSENSFFTVKSIEPQGISAVDDQGNTIGIGQTYVEKIMQSGDLYATEEKKTMTELAEIFRTSPRVAMTVAFYKKDQKKSKTAFNKEIKQAVERASNAKVSEIEGIILDLVNNPITDVIPGELRVMRGRHYGSINDLGRVAFLDMEEVKKDGDYDNRMKQVDPRTIQYLIVDNIKYSLK